MCCTESNNAAPQLHAVASTWSSWVELPVQRLFLGIAADLNLILFGGDSTDVYANSPIHSKNYLDIDEAYADLTKYQFKKEINRKHALSVHHCL